MEPDQTPRRLGEDDELPDDFGGRIGDTLTFGSGSYIRTVSGDEARRRFPQPRPRLGELDAAAIDRALAFADGWMAATGERQPEPGSVLDSQPRRRGLNRLIPIGRRGGTAGAGLRAARRRPMVVPPARLTIELVPKTSWYNNVRALVDEPTWGRIRRQVYRQANYRCEICGGKGPEHPVECHEVWRYDDRTRVQLLVRMIALCPVCHQVKHIGLANVKGKGAQARGHLARVNGWTLEEADAYIAEAFGVWAQRSRGSWTLDLEGLRPYVLGSEYARIVAQAAIDPAERCWRSDY